MTAESESVADLLRAWTRAALARSRNALEGSRDDTGRTADNIHAVSAAQVRRSAQHMLTRVASEYDCENPLLALPVDLLRRIFLLTWVNDRWALSQTCRRLRAVCLGTPALWRTISVSSWHWVQPRPLTTGFINTALLLAARCIPEELDFRLLYPINGPGEEAIAVAFLSQLLPRLRFLALSPVWQGHWGRLLELLESPAPALRELRVRVTHTTNTTALPPAVLPRELFAGARGGRLCAVELSLVELPGPGEACGALWNVRKFTWTKYNGDNVVDSAELCHILALMLRLEKLHLEMCELIWNYDEVAIPDSCRLVSIELGYFGTFTNGMCCLRDLSMLSNIGGHISRRGKPTQMLRELSEYPLQAYVGESASVIIVQPANFAHPLSIWGTVENLFELEDVAVHDAMPALTISPFAARSLTTLSLHESYWTDTEALPSFPRLQWLRILLTSCASHRVGLALGSRHDSGRCVLAECDLSPWNAPALDTLLIAYVGSQQPCGHKPILSDEFIRSSWPCYCSKPLSVSLAGVHQLVKLSILQPGQRLSHLELQGVEVIDHDPWGSVGLFEAISDEFAASIHFDIMACDYNNSGLVPDGRLADGGAL